MGTTVVAISYWSEGLTFSSVACVITKRASSLPDAAIPGERVRLGAHAGGQVADEGDHLLRRFADLVFVRPQDKLKLYWLFARSAWQPARRAA